MDDRAKLLNRLTHQAVVNVNIGSHACYVYISHTYVYRSRSLTEMGRVRISTRALAPNLNDSTPRVDLTWSCYSHADQACGVCDSCVLRLRAFQVAGIQDPIPYAAR